jgi:MFS transporter, DHA3 family, macrolide efflux protein
MVKSSTPRATLIQVFRNTSFLKFWVGQLVSYLGDRIDQMAMIAVLSAGVGAARGGFHASMVTFWATLPYVLVSPFAGTLIDRFDRRKLMIWMDVLRGCVVLCVPFLVNPSTHPWIIYAIVGCIGAATSVFAPAKSAFIPEIVPQEQLLRANSVTTTMGTLTVLIGTVLGSQLVAALSYRPSLIIDAATYFFSAAMLIWIRMPRVEELVVNARRSEMKSEGDYLANVRRGFRFLVRHRVPGLCVLLDSWFFLVGGLLFTAVNEIVFLLLAGTDLQAARESAEMRSLGYAYAALGCGLATGGVLMGFYGSRPPLRAVFPVCLGITAALVLGLMSHPGLKGLCALLFCIGYAGGSFAVTIETTLQKTVPDEIRGRVFALNNLMLNAVLLASIAFGGMALETRLLSINQALGLTAALAVIGGVGSFFGFKGSDSISTMRQTLND